MRISYVFRLFRRNRQCYSPFVTANRGQSLAQGGDAGKPVSPQTNPGRANSLEEALAIVKYTHQTLVEGVGEHRWPEYKVSSLIE